MLFRKQSKKLHVREGERQIILLLGDLLISSLSVVIALYFWAQRDWLEFSWRFLDQRAPFWFYLLPLIWSLLLIDLYDVRKANRHSDVLRGIGTAAGLGVVLYLLIFFLSESNSLPRRGVAVFLVSATFFSVLWRFIYISIFSAPVFDRRALIIGAGKAGSTLAGMIGKIKPLPFQLVGYIDDDPKKQGKTIENLRVVGDADDLIGIIRENQISDLIFAISGELSADLFRSVLAAQEEGISITSLPTIYEEIFGRVPIFLLQSDWILRSFLDQSKTSGVYEFVKRFLDIFSGLVGLCFLILLYPIIALSILLDDGSPILYSQMRVGKNGQHYKVYKFRTMRKESQNDGVARMTSSDDKRITRFGKFLRRSHVDELPQVINILKGENSLIGPRAEQIELVDQFQKQIPFYRARLYIKPGLTGWAQVNQRYASTVEDTAVKLEYDLYYIKHRNLLLDLNIAVRTIGAVLGFRGL